MGAYDMVLKRGRVLLMGGAGAWSWVLSRRP